MTAAIDEAKRLLRLAERDRLAFGVLAESPDVADAVIGFHAQQAVEKALKAVLFMTGQDFRRTHDLEELSWLLQDAQRELPVTRDDLRKLNPYAVEFRYEEGDLAGMSRSEMQRVADAILNWAFAQLEQKSER